MDSIVLGWLVGFSIHRNFCVIPGALQSIKWIKVRDPRDVLKFLSAQSKISMLLGKVERKKTNNLFIDLTKKISHIVNDWSSRIRFAELNCLETQRY